MDLGFGVANQYGKSPLGLAKSKLSAILPFVFAGIVRDHLTLLG